MKNKSLIAIIIGMTLIFTGVITFIATPSDKDKTPPKTENKEEQKELRKILLEEINDENAQEIIQFYLDKDSSKEKIIIKNAQILATNEKGKFYVRLEIENQRNTWDTEIQYLEEGKWEVKLPLVELGNYGNEYTQFWGVVEE